MLKVVASCIKTQLRTSDRVEVCRCNIVILMAAIACLMMSFSSCIVCGFDSYTVLCNCPQRKFPPPPPGRRKQFPWGHWKLRYANQFRTRYRNWRIISAMQLQPPKSLCYIGYTSKWWQHDCWLTVQTLYAIYKRQREYHKVTCKTEGGLLFRDPPCIIIVWVKKKRWF